MKAKIFFKNGYSLKSLFTSIMYRDIRFVGIYGNLYRPKEWNSSSGGILKKTSTLQIHFIPDYGNHTYDIILDKNYDLKEIHYNGFAGTIFQHELFSVENEENLFNINEISRFIDVEKTKNQEVFSSRLSKEMPLMEYLISHYNFQCEQYDGDEYNYYNPQSPLYDLLKDEEFFEMKDFAGNIVGYTREKETKTFTLPCMLGKRLFTHSSKILSDGYNIY